MVVSLRLVVVVAGWLRVGRCTAPAHPWPPSFSTCTFPLGNPGVHTPGMRTCKTCYCRVCHAGHHRRPVTPHSCQLLPSSVLLTSSDVSSSTWQLSTSHANTSAVFLPSPPIMSDLVRGPGSKNTRLPAAVAACAAAWMMGGGNSSKAKPLMNREEEEAMSWAAWAGREVT